MSYRAIVLFAAAALSLSVSAASAATTIGFTGDRDFADLGSNFIIALTEAVFEDSVITSWQAHIEAIDDSASEGSLALVILRDVGGGLFDVIASDTEMVSLGVNVFSSNISVAAGDILAVWMGTAKVGYDDFASASGSGLSSAFDSFTSAPSGQIAVNGGSFSRYYSIEATVEPAVVPLPAASLMLLGALGGLAALRRRKSA